MEKMVINFLIISEAESNEVNYIFLKMLLLWYIKILVTTSPGYYQVQVSNKLLFKEKLEIYCANLHGERAMESSHVAHYVSIL
jgi:CRISPR/Cas system CSM-associated protein Csm3 (group 7 of RAMP superfamily)